MCLRHVFSVLAIVGSRVRGGIWDWIYVVVVISPVIRNIVLGLCEEHDQT